MPSLAEILKALPEDLHPQSVAGFFLTRQPDLVLHGEPGHGEGVAGSRRLAPRRPRAS